MEHLDINPGDLAKHIKRKQDRPGTKVTIEYRISKKEGHRSKPLGFIRYKGDNGTGTVEFTNFDVTLQPWHLDMGGTGKRNKARMVGTHGEGLNIAVLAMMRPEANHDIRCFSGGYEWTFRFNETGTLCVELTRINDEVLQRMLELNGTGTKRTYANPGTDISVIVGSRTQHENDRGQEVELAGVSEEDFNSWLETTLFLQMIPPNRIIYTAAGNLVKPPPLPPRPEGDDDNEENEEDIETGRMFHKGFLLAPPCERSKSMSGKPFRFTYDSYEGQVNRDRGAMSNADMEGKATAKIWEQVLDQEPGMVQDLSDMLMDRRQWADVHEWHKHCVKNVAQKVKQNLVEKHPNTWFVSESEARVSTS